MSEARALVRLGVEEVASAPHGIKSFHLAIADRVFNAVGPAGKPVRIIHDGVSGAVYGGIGQAIKLGGRGLETAIGRRQTQHLSDTPQGALVISIVNGLVGDKLAEDQNEITRPMEIRRIREPRTGRIAVFLHGLMETEFSWGGSGNYGDRLAADGGWTPVYVRYNTGLRISHNGRCLADLLEQATRDWPVEIDEIALIGHSMGGLVCRSAAHQAGLDGFGWVESVRHVISLGTPHRGAPLEEIVHVGSAALDLLPETRGISRFLRRRSGGIRDLRRGSLVDDDWKDRDPDALRAEACEEIPLLDGVKHCFVSASGDLLVLGRSAAPWRDEEAFRIKGGHFALLNHPEVYERLRDWLS